MGRPLIDSKEVSKDLIHICALYIPNRPFEECMKGNSFKFTERAMRTIIAQRVLSIVFKTISKIPSEDFVKQLFSIVLKRKALRTRFRTLCNQAVATRKNNTR